MRSIVFKKSNRFHQASCYQESKRADALFLRLCRCYRRFALVIPFCQLKQVSTVTSELHLKLT